MARLGSSSHSQRRNDNQSKGQKPPTGRARKQILFAHAQGLKSRVDCDLEGMVMVSITIISIMVCIFRRAQVSWCRL
jgi:hypothetical protein